MIKDYCNICLNVETKGTIYAAMHPTKEILTNTTQLNKFKEIIFELDQIIQHYVIAILEFYE